MSRRSPRYRHTMTVTATFEGDVGQIVGRTKNVSDSGVYLESRTRFRPGTKVHISLIDDESGEVIELTGEVARQTEAATKAAWGGLGIKFNHPPDHWKAFVERVRRSDKTAVAPKAPAGGKRLCVLVVGDEARRRTALALYVTSGWDVRFASDLSGTYEALGAGVRLDAVIAEHDLNDTRWPEYLEAARTSQPAARRIVRAHLPGGTAPPPGDRADLVHRVVDIEAGLEAILDALSADWEARPE